MCCVFIYIYNYNSSSLEMMDRVRASNIIHQSLMLRFTLLLLLLRVSGSYSTITNSNIARLNIKESQSPAEPPNLDHQRVLPLLAPSPLMPFTNIGVPKLSGKCPLNFSKAETESIITTTAIDCWGPLAPYLANVVCCPQLDATINILIAQSSLSASGSLTINHTHAQYCLSDITQLLEAQGSYNHLLEICSINPTNLTRTSCPLLDIENILNNSKVVESCKSIDPVKECSSKVCDNAVTKAAVNMASKNDGVLDAIDDCKKIVLRWLASKLEPSDASKVLRGISSCEINKVCPLVFPDMNNVSKECGNTINNQTTCCDTLEHYFTQLQDQSFITNLQAISCASSLASSLQKANVTLNLYDICRVRLKDFSLQVGSQDSGCLFPSLPFDVTYDQSSGIDFKCDLNDNVAAPWPRPSSNPNLPALPKATSDQKGLKDNLFISTLLILAVFI